MSPRALGATGLAVTPLAFGCAALGDMPATFGYGVPEERALAALRAALSGPVTMLDTAGAYGDGESERRIGLALRELGGLPPGRVLATKAGRDPRTGRFGADEVRRSVERSLRLLGLERLQLVHLHDPEHTTFEAALAPGGPVAALERLQGEGLVAHIGIAGGPVDLLARFVATGRFAVVVTHNRYTLLHRGARPLLALAARRGVAVLNAAPYASGLLARGPGSGARYAYRPAPADVIWRARSIEARCRARGVPLAAAALGHSLREPSISATIVGVDGPEQVEETLRLAGHPIPDELWPELEAYADDERDPEAPAGAQPARGGAGAPGDASSSRSR